MWHTNNRAAVFSADSQTLTMMQPCASAAKAARRRTHP